MGKADSRRSWKMGRKKKQRKKKQRERRRREEWTAEQAGKGAAEEQAARVVRVRTGRSPEDGQSSLSVAAPQTEEVKEGNGAGSGEE